MLRKKVNLMIVRFEEDVELYKVIRDCLELLRDYMHQRELFSFVHTREYF